MGLSAVFLISGNYLYRRECNLLPEHLLKWHLYHSKTPLLLWPDFQYGLLIGYVQGLSRVRFASWNYRVSPR